MELSLEQIDALLHAAYEKGRAAVVKAWDEGQHPRGQPDNAGEFAPSKGTSSHGDDYAKNGTKSAAFKNWFGDWENEPDQASKVVDDKGEPQETHGVKAVYHGTQADFTTFDGSKESIHGRQAGAGFYFAENEDIAKQYGAGGGKVIGAYLNIRNPFDFDSTVDVPRMREMATAAGEWWKENKPGTKHVQEHIASQVLKSFGRREWSQDKTLSGYSAHKAISDVLGEGNVNGVMSKLGYDGVTHMSQDEYGTVRTRDKQEDHGRVWIAFEPTQIKSVDNEGTFDPSNPHIRKSWDEKQHPRGDDGRFINAGEISQAAKNPAKAAELRKRVTDPEERGKLNAAIGDAGKADKQLAGQYSKPSPGFGAGLGPKRPASREPGETATTGHHPHGDRPSVLETVEMVRGLKSKALDEGGRGELAKRLEGHSVEELRDIKSQLGLRITGRKAELASKILMAANGMEYPEQGFTGALPVRGQGVHHYVDGQLSHIEHDPAPGVHASRVTPEEAHAVIDYHLANGTLLKQETRDQIAHMLMNRMSYRDISELKRRLGLKASGRKQVYADRIQTLVEDRERRARQNPDHPANKPDPMGTMGSLAERQADIAGKQATYGKYNADHPDRQAAVSDAADRLRMAVQSPFAAFNRDAALGEVKAAMNDLYNTGEFNAAAHLAGIKLDPKDGTPIQQMAAAVFKLAGGDDSPMAQKPTNLLDGLGSEQSATAIPANHTHKISGDTYPNREAIKKAGGTWDKVGKQWTIDEEGAQYLPDGVTAEPMAHRMPKTDTAVKPEETRTAHDAAQEQPAAPVVATPTVPDSVRKQAEALKQWHQKASRHEVEYQKMLPWTADMMREGDTKQRADVAKRMGALIAKHPELADEYGPYVKKGPNLPAVPTPEEHLAKYGHDADHMQVVDDYMNAGGHPNDLYRHLKPEAANESYSNRTGLIGARTKAIDATKGHLAGKAPPAEAAVSILPGGAGLKKIAENIFDAHQRHLANPKPGVKPPADEFLQQADRVFRPRSLTGHTREEEDVIASHLRDMMGRNAAGASAAKPNVSSEDTSPGRTEHLQAVASAAGHDELRDAADTVARIEDIPHGERTADDRSELKRAKELAAANTVEPVSKPTAQPQIVEPATPTGDLFNDYVPTAKRVASPEETAAKQKQDTAAIEEAVGMKTVATREREEAASPSQSTPTADDHEKAIRDIKPGESAKVAGHVVRRGKLDDETVSIDLPEGGVRTDTVNGAAKYLANKLPRLPSQSVPKLQNDPDAPDTLTSHGKASAVPIGVTDKADFKRKSMEVESVEYLLPL